MTNTTIKNQIDNPEEFTLTGICARYCRERPLRPNTVRMYNRVVSLFERDTGISRLDDLTMDRLLQWRDDVASRSSITTFNNYRRHVMALLNFCVDQGFIEINPMKRLKPYTRANARRRGCTKAELLSACQFLSSDRDNPASPVMLAIILTLYYTGVRCAQLCGLSWQDIDFDDNTILLRKLHSKNGREWRIPMHDTLGRKLQAIKKDQFGRFAGIDKSSQVFRIQLYSNLYAGDRLTPEQLSCAFMRVSKRCGVRISPHRIRHLFATILANQHHGDYAGTGEPPATLVAIKEILGHTNITTTAGYIEPSLSTQRALIGDIEDLDDF